MVGSLDPKTARTVCDHLASLEREGGTTSRTAFDVQKYMTLTRHVYSPAIIAMGMGAWRKVPAADQQILARAAAEVAPYQRKLGRDQEAKWVKALEQRGMEVVETVDAAAWQSALKPVFDTYAAQFGDRFRRIVETR